MTNTLLFSQILHQNKVTTFDDRGPQWMAEFIKSKLQQQNSIYKNYHHKSSKNLDYEILQSEIDNVSSIIYQRKSDNHSKQAQKLIDPFTSSITYWSILKTFFNGLKIPLISPMSS